MDNNENNSIPESPLAVAGPSGTARKRSHSTSLSNSSSSSSSSSSSDQKRGKRRRHRHNNHHKKSKRSKNNNFDKLFKEIQELRKHVFAPTNDTLVGDNVSLCSGVSGELFEENTVDENTYFENEFTFNIETKLKEPSVPPTPEKFLKLLLNVQRLGSTSWSDIRYAETQKLYNHSPGFTELQTNEEVISYDTLRYQSNIDKSYAALTFCVLKQKESLQNAIRSLLAWAKDIHVNPENLSSKVEELFLNGDFHKTSSDLLQLVCGHRAEIIEMRRESITSKAKDPLVKAALNKIPPSTSYLFDSDLFKSTLEKAGGVRKAFWPLKSEEPKKSATNRRLSRGQGLHKIVPSRGTQYGSQDFGYPEQTYTHMHVYNNPPSRGGHQSMSNANRANFVNPYSNIMPSNRRPFHQRGSRPANRGQTRGRVNATRSKGTQRKQ
ncbi:unnamed protein product [Euphydryas editha]|uniref:Gag protein n=1 Tax=Euphydryas editha TaxID=104508 RepID=A0AAU9UHQ5_EUPED|nr:unnamed protein product [Euphydryas editha]